MEYLKRFVLWLIAGAGVTLGVLLVSRINDAMREAQKPTHVLEQDADYTVEAIQVVPFAKVLTVRGKITNKSSKQSDTTLDLELTKDGETLYRCDWSAGPRPFPGKTISFQIECPKLDPEKIPAGTLYVVRVRTVVR